MSSILAEGWSATYRKHPWDPEAPAAAPEPTCQGNVFVAVDGEGVGNDYVLLDSSLPFTKLYTGSRLTTEQCLGWLWELAESCPEATFVLYGAGYDFNNWLRDLSFASLCRLRGKEEDPQPVRFGDWYVKWVDRVCLEIRRIDPHLGGYCRLRNRGESTQSNRRSVRFYDVLPFWQQSFTAALDNTLSDGGSERDLLDAGKAARGLFRHDAMDWVSRYNKMECLNLVRMMHELDSWLQSVGISIRSYHGPGAIAKALLSKHETYRYASRGIRSEEGAPYRMVRSYYVPGIAELPATERVRKLQSGDLLSPDLMWEIMLTAYAGGRVEAWGRGHTDDWVYEYDINSAYPAATVGLPCLSHGSWYRCRDYQPDKFGVYKVNYEGSGDPTARHPYFFRKRDGSIQFPSRVAGKWAYSSELRAGLEWAPGSTQIVDGWVWGQSCDHRPFQWVSDYYLWRKSLKDQGSGGQLALKLGLNSLYGSLAQARGGQPDHPPWSQQLMWAGAITASVRAQLYVAAMQDPGAVFHLSTDGLLCLRPLAVHQGTELGDWELSTHRGCDVVQPGVYFTEGKNKSRGLHFDTDSDVDTFLAGVRERWRTRSMDPVPVRQRTFVTAGLVCMAEKRYEEWCHWQETEKEIRAVELSDDGYATGDPNRIVPLETYGAWYDYPSQPYSPHWATAADYPSQRALVSMLKRQSEGMSSMV